MSKNIENMVNGLIQDLKGSGFRITRVRREILRILAEAKEHLSADEIYYRLRKKHPRAGYATVYRTLKVLMEEGIAKKSGFYDDISRYEIRGKEEREHHDHIVCVKCGRVVEFTHEKVETLQKEIARKYGFVITDHKMELYGVCKECQKGSKE